MFARPDEWRTIRQDAGGTPAPHVAGTLIAARTVRDVVEVVDVVCGPDTLLFAPDDPRTTSGPTRVD